MSHNRRSYLLAALALIAAAAACNQPAAGTAPAITLTPADIGTTLPEIISATPPAATSIGSTGIPVGVTSVFPTAAPTAIPATQAPAPPPVPAGTRVNFAAGATQAQVTGSLAAGGIDRYVIGVGAGQVIEVDAGQTAGLTLVITNAYGATLASGAASAITTAPATADYVVLVQAGSSPQSYQATIIIPERVSFAQGATEATIQGQVSAGSAHQYALGLQAGQLVDILFSTSSGFHSALYGVDGHYLQGAAGTGVGFRGPVPTTQDYVLAVDAGAADVSYTIRVIVPDRLTFGEGATSLEAQGTLAANGVYEYVLGLSAGQALQIQSNAGTGYGLSVTGPGDVVVPGASTTAPFFRGTVPADGDYVIILAGGASTTSYDLSIVVPVRISFASGANSATETGGLAAHQTIDYVISGNASHQMSVTFTPAGSARMSIYGNDGTVQWSGMGEGTSWTGSLPGTQDYFIVFSAGDTPVPSYSLTVSIQ